MDDSQYDPLYLRGVELFNACDFFECHEAWEELWADQTGPSRRFLQGLIQAAVALHHFGNGNIRGAKKLFYTSRGYLEPFRPAFMGLDLERFLTAMERCFAQVIASPDTFPNVELIADEIPEIHLNPPAAGVRS